MAAFNRFPLLGLWAEGGARRLGYTKDEAQSLGHAYAVLYAIRARGRPEKRAIAQPKNEATADVAKPSSQPRLDFGGDHLDVTYDARGKVRGSVGHEHAQTPETYRASIAAKFPANYYSRLETAFGQVLKAYPPRRLNSRLLYRLYDQWKQACAVGRLVDLDRLLAWCRDQVESYAN